jgi:hypothetical protein
MTSWKSALLTSTMWESFVAASPVKTSAPLARKLAWAALVAAYGSNSSEWSMRFGRGGLSWRILASELRAGSTPFAATWRDFAMQRFRFHFARLISALLTTEPGCSSWPGSLFPTLTRNRSTYARRRGTRSETLRGVLGGPPNPQWLEWFMGFPSGWTELGP